MKKVSELSYGLLLSIDDGGGCLFQGAGEEVEGLCDPIGVSDGRLCQVVVAELDGVGD